jgi:hypothetical protein
VTTAAKTGSGQNSGRQISASAAPVLLAMIIGAASSGAMRTR